MLTLYKAGNSICTQKVFITLRQKELEWEEVNLDLFKNDQYSPSYLKINPKGVVPALVHDGKIVTESTVICEYLDEAFPKPPLLPRDPFGRAQARQWSKAIDEGIFEGTREISFTAMFREKMKKMTAEERETRFRNIGDPGRRARYVSTYEEGVESPYVLQAIVAFEKLFLRMQAALAPGNNWLLGDTHTLADINVMPFVARLANLQLLDVWVDDKPEVAAWWERVQLFDHFKASVSDLLSKDEYEAMRVFGTAIKERIRTKRAEYLELIASQKAMAGGV